MITINDITNFANSFSIANLIGGLNSSAKSTQQTNNSYSSLLSSIINKAAEDSGVTGESIDLSKYYETLEALGYDTSSESAPQGFEDSIQEKLNTALANGELSKAQICKISNALLSYQTCASLLSSTFQLYA